MVSIASKLPTTRSATATSMLLFSEPDTYTSLVSAQLKKGDALAVARVAGIQAAKKTSDLIPLAHPSLAITGLSLSIEPFGPRGLPSEDILPTQSNHFFKYGGVYIQAKVDCEGKTGVEMEAMMAASVAGLTMYDMLKGVDKAMTLTDIRVLKKSGGKSGDWSYDYKTKSIVKSGEPKESSGKLSTTSGQSDVHGKESTGPRGRGGTLSTHNDARKPQQEPKARSTTAAREVPKIRFHLNSPKKLQNDGNQNEPSIKYSTTIHNINYTTITHNTKTKTKASTPKETLTEHDRKVKARMRIRKHEVNHGIRVPGAMLSRMADINHILTSSNDIETSSLEGETKQHVMPRVKRGQVTAHDLRNASRRRRACAGL
jgi:molybdenum cofactor biosynthesis enzyme